MAGKLWISMTLSHVMFRKKNDDTEGMRDRENISRRFGWVVVFLKIRFERLLKLNNATAGKSVRSPSFR